MSKVKSDKVPHYELLYLISNKFSDNELEPIKTKIEKLITDNGGAITLSQDWGKKRLAYAIKGFYHGYYHLLEFDLPGDKINYVDNQIRLASEILRHQVLKTEPKTAEEIKAQEAVKQMVLQKHQTQAEAEKVAEPEIAKTETKTEADKEKEKIELNDLDDKLNRILESDNLL